MKYEDLVQNIRNTLGEETPKPTAIAVLNNLLEGIVTAIQKGEEVTLRGIGRFTTRTRAARMARNVRTGEPVAVPEKVVVKFIPRGLLKEL